jgi:hypothetical protein
VLLVAAAPKDRHKDPHKDLRKGYEAAALRPGVAVDPWAHLFIGLREAPGRR